MSKKAVQNSDLDPRIVGRFMITTVGYELGVFELGDDEEAVNGEFYLKKPTNGPPEPDEERIRRYFGWAIMSFRGGQFMGARLHLRNTAIVARWSTTPLPEFFTLLWRLVEREICGDQQSVKGK